MLHLWWVQECVSVVCYQCTRSGGVQTEMCSSQQVFETHQSTESWHATMSGQICNNSFIIFILCTLDWGITLVSYFIRHQEAHFEMWGYFFCCINDLMFLFPDPQWDDAQEGSWEGPGAGQEDWGSPQEEWSAHEEVQGKDKCLQAEKLLWSPEFRRSSSGVEMSSLRHVSFLWKSTALSGFLISLLFSLSCI